MIDSDFEVIHLPQVDSTSAYLKRMIAEGHLSNNTVCITDHQTGGYGQRSRTWIHAAQSLAVSYAVALNEPINPTISAQVALLLHKYLTAYSGEFITLKWPNDLFTKSGKVAGILIEVQANRQSRQKFLVIGIGLNLVSTPSVKSSDYPIGVISHLDRDAFLSSFSQALYEQFSFGLLRIPFSSDQWSKVDYFHPNQPVIVYDTDQTIEARYIGVNERAELILQVDNKLVSYQSSRISVRAIKENETLIL